MNLYLMIYLMIYLIGVGISLLLCFIITKYVQKELSVNDLPIAIACIAGSFVGVLAILITVVCVYVDNNGDKIIWKRKGENNE